MNSVGGVGGAFGSAVLGMVLAQQRMDASAGALAAGMLPGSAPAAPGASGDIALALVDQLQAVSSFGLNAAVARSADNVMAETINLGEGSAPR